MGVIRSGSRVQGEEEGDRDIIQRVFLKVQLAGRERDVEPAQNTRAVVPNFESEVVTLVLLLLHLQTTIRFPAGDESLQLTHTDFFILDSHEGHVLND